ncbi:MAG: helix-turn-helix domain-containing protein [Gemmatimonadetes bacterium]|nr:helix-turn-helix domain-containing protein [Gemmatimonadota bacterium]
MPTDAPGPLSPAAAYREHAPPAALRDALVCLWSHASAPDGAERAQPVLPDGCVDVLWVSDAEPVVAGPATRSIVARVAPGTTIVGARFRPGWCAGVLGVDASELRDLHLPLRDVAPALARRLSTSVADREARMERVAVAGALLARHLACVPPDGVVRGAVQWLARHPQGRMDGLSRALHVSPRQLQRRLLAASGYTPRTLRRILRFQRLLALADAAGPGARLSSLALRAGYADQAHMTRDVRDLAGTTPAALLPGAGSALRMANLFDS